MKAEALPTIQENALPTDVAMVPQDTIRKVTSDGKSKDILFSDFEAQVVATATEAAETYTAETLAYRDEVAGNASLVADNTLLVAENTATVVEDTALVVENTAIVAQNTATVLLKAGEAEQSAIDADSRADAALVSEQNADLSEAAALQSKNYASGYADAALQAKIDAEAARDVVLNILEIEENTIKITASRNGVAGVDADFVGRNAIQDAIDSISDNSIIKQYHIEFDGIFDATLPEHFTKGDVGGVGQVDFIAIKNYVHLVGKSKSTSIIMGVLAGNLGAGFAYSRFNVVSGNASSYIKNCTITGENVRYPLHIDGGSLGNENYVYKIYNSKIWHKGNTGHAVNWSSWHPIGLGTSSGQEIDAIDCEIVGKSNSLYIHTNSNFAKSSKFNLDNCSLDNGGDTAINVQALGSGVNDILSLKNCNVKYGLLLYSSPTWGITDQSKLMADHSEIDIIANDVIPMAFQNNLLTGKGLRIGSKALGSSSIVSFDPLSTAFKLIIGNENDVTEIINKFGYQQVYGYEYRNGGNGLAGWASGLLDIEYRAPYTGSLGKRLGDCSTVNKTLTVYIDGSAYNIIFNKNYNGTAAGVAPNYTNTQIIAEIVAVITAVATVIEFSVGQRYYPKFKGLSWMVNADTAECSSGMGIIRTGVNTFRKALNTDNRIDGICIDTLRVGDSGRVIESGSLYSSYTGQSFRLNEKVAATRAIGSESGISTTTAGQFDTAASPKLLRVTRIAEVWDIIR